MTEDPRERWRNPREWIARAVMLAGFVPPGSVVLDVGAGTRILEKKLPAGCTYIPLDWCDRGAGTFLCDLNADELPEFPRADVVVCGGVLEYIEDLPRFLAHLPKRVDLVVASYAVTDRSGQYQEGTRESHGWVNAYTSKELLDLFVDAGFQEVEVSGSWGLQIIVRAWRKKREGLW